MSLPVIRPLVAVLVVSLLVAGCASPGDDGGDEEGAEFTEQTQPGEDGVGPDDGDAESPTPDQDAGAEPVAPPDDNQSNATTREEPETAGDT